MVILQKVVVVLLFTLKVKEPLFKTQNFTIIKVKTVLFTLKVTMLKLIVPLSKTTKLKTVLVFTL